MTASAAYHYRAVRPDGSRTAGHVHAASREAALDALHQRGWHPLDVRLARGTSLGVRRLPTRDLALGLRMLASLLDSGLPVGRAVTVFSDLAPPRWRTGLPMIETALRDGKTLAAALGEAPLGIPPVVLGIIRAGDAGAGMVRAVNRAADMMERAAETQRALRAALAYPVVLMLTGLTSVSVLVGLVIPRFAALLSDLGQRLPTSTRIVLDLAAAARTLAAPAGSVALAATITIAFAVRTEAGRRLWHTLLLSLPAIGTVRRSVASSRAAFALASLLDAGVPIATALPHAAQACADDAIATHLESARVLILHGERASTALAREHALTSTVTRLLRAGEEAGRVPEMLEHAATIERNQAEEQVRRFVRLLEPTFILVFGMIVAFVAAALLQAVYAVRPVH